MKSDVAINEYSIDINNCCAENGVSITKTNENDFIALPALYEDKYYYAQETIEFLKFCREKDSEQNYDVLSDGDIEVRSLHSFDIWLPIIFVAKNVLLPFAISMVSSYLWERRKGHEKEETQVDVTFLVKEGEKESTIHYKGDAKSFTESFDTIDLNKLLEG